jgi:hypothetical protein
MLNRTLWPMKRVMLDLRDPDATARDAAVAVLARREKHPALPSSPAAKTATAPSFPTSIPITSWRSV